MKIVEFGEYFKNVDRFSYISSRTLLEFDMLFFDFNYILKNSTQTQEQEYLKRKKDLENFILYKNIPLVFFTPTPKNIHVIVGISTAQRTFDFFAPIPKIETEKLSGSKIEIESNSLFANFILKYEEYFHYHAYFKSNPGTAIASTPLMKQPLGFWNRDCVFLPSIKTTIQSIEEEFFKDLYSILKKIRIPHQESELPEWTKKYLLPTEGDLIDNINAVSAKIESLNQQLQTKTEQYQSVISKKTFFVATGAELEEQVEKLLVEIGFNVLEAVANREDLIVQYKDKIAVVEIKGVNSSSAEKHAAQLEKWSAEYFERTGTKPKPILIVNAYKDKPLIERNEPVFPNQMLKYSISRGHCLISTLQLLGMYYHIKDSPDEIDNQIEKLFSTAGEYQDFTDWTNFISCTP